MEPSVVEADNIEEDMEELTAGRPIWINGLLCQITSPLGMGSFGVVWAAECEGVGEVAVKEIVCQTETELSRAAYEAQLLYVLTHNSMQKSRWRDESKEAPLRTIPAELARIPAYVASDVTSAGSGAFRMRLAMSRVCGAPLDRFLSERQVCLQKICEPIENSPAQSHSHLIAEAFHFGRALITQIVPAMEFITSLAYHRDVNAHNILISIQECREGSEPQFGLVDFGLAVDAALWKDKSATNPHGQSEWRHLDVGGDCRYWPTSAWLQFEVGCYELAESQALCQEYQTHLDFQGLGITALQVLAEMLPVRTASGATLGINTTPELSTTPELQKLQVVWASYWESATHFWAELLETFRNAGDWNALKNKFISIGVHEIISNKLHAVRVAIAEARDAFMKAPPAAGFRDACVFFTALLVMISSGEERVRPTSWEDVRLCLGWGGDGNKPQSSRTLGASPRNMSSTTTVPWAPSASGSSSSIASGDTLGNSKGPLLVAPRLHPEQLPPQTPLRELNVGLPTSGRGQRQPETALPLPSLVENCSDINVGMVKKPAYTEMGAGVVAGGESLTSSSPTLEPAENIQPSDFHTKLNEFSERVAKLACDMRKLEQNDQILAAALAKRLNGQALL